MSFALSPAATSPRSGDTSMRRIQTALLSAYDKRGVVELAQALNECGATLIASGGTADTIRAAGLPVLSVEEYTGLPPGFGGRVKTLHPRIHAGILARRDEPEDLRELERGGARPIDLVYVDLYPFEDAVRSGASREAKIEKIDVGGPTMLRAAAKNADFVASLGAADEIPAVIEELRANAGALGGSTRRRLAAHVFARTASYDAAIAHELAGDGGTPVSAAIETTAKPERSTSSAGDDASVDTPFAATRSISLVKVAGLRYGENPHQRAALYRETLGEGVGSAFENVQGEELSYNNWVDLVAAAELAAFLPQEAVVLVKHTNPCGAAVRATQALAWDAALAADPVSAFGGIAGFNSLVTGETARKMASLFLEIVVAPEFSPEALLLFAKKPKLRVVRVSLDVLRAPRTEIKSLPGGNFLLQDSPGNPGSSSTWKLATRQAASPLQMADLQFAWVVAAHVKSNAIVFAKNQATIGVGAGQMSRVDSVRIAIQKATEHGHDLRGSVVGSDAFFPFADGPQLAFAAGAVAVAQPGGSKRDEETIAAADKAGVAMYFTGRRTFRH